MSRTNSLLVFAIVGCGGGATQVAAPSETRVVIYAVRPPSSVPPPSGVVATAIENAPAKDTKPAVAAPVEQSVRFLTNTVLRKEPRTDADKVGIIRKEAVAALVTTTTADGCKDDRWIQIAPRGWACESATEETSDQPTAGTTVDLNAIDDDGVPLVPGIYGVVRGANVSTSVRAAAVVTIDGAKYWRTSGGAVIPAAAIAQFSPSKFRGIALDKHTNMPAWIRGRSDSRKPVRTYRSPRGRVAGELAPRTIVSVLEESDDGKFVRVADELWVSRKDLRVASMTTPPPGTGPKEKWFDVDRDEQVLVAYEGEQPVYATLVSTGKWGHATPTVITRMSSKLLTASMNNDRGDEQYAVADVPWTMYYDNSYAIHTSYWHDGFGGPRSHGCVNLAPRDARLLYQWSSPDVPPGWIAVYGDEDHPGSLVRVRSREMPEPRFRGYAKRVRERSIIATN